MRDTASTVRTVDEEVDTAAGIYHLKIGADQGLVKQIEFTQQDIPFLKEERIVDGADAASKDGFLRTRYDAKITLVGNSLFTPGQYIYIHPSVPGGMGVHRSDLEKIGLGGYYLVITVFHMVSQDYYQTEIEARWESYGSVNNVSTVPPLIPIEIKSKDWKCTLRKANPEAASTYTYEKEESTRVLGGESALVYGSDAAEWIKGIPGYGHLAEFIEGVVPVSENLNNEWKEAYVYKKPEDPDGGEDK